MKPRKYPVQTIGDRRVTKPRTQTIDLKDNDGNTLETAMLSLELCGCGYSHANHGVGYRAKDGWICKRCNQLHTTDDGKIHSEDNRLTPDPDMVEEFDRRSTQPPPFTCSTAADLRAEQNRRAEKARRGKNAPRTLATTT